MKKQKEAYYFSHDSNARTDPKIRRLRAEHGAAGYGVYFMLLEMLREANAYTLPYDCFSIAYELHVEEDLVADVVEKYGLFVVEDGNFFSLSLHERMKMREAIREKRRESGRLGGVANAKQKSSKQVARKGKERKEKVKESDLESSYEDSCAEPKSSSPAFIEIPILGNQAHSVSEEDIRDFEESFPAVDVRQALRTIRQWNLSNPKKQKTKRGIRGHITTWLGREQDKGGVKTKGNHEQNRPSYSTGGVSKARQREIENKRVVDEFIAETSSLSTYNGGETLVVSHDLLPGFRNDEGQTQDLPRGPDGSDGGPTEVRHKGLLSGP